MVINLEGQFLSQGQGIMYEPNFTTEVSDPWHAQHNRPQGRCKDLKRPCFSFPLTFSSVEPHISMCAYQQWLVTRNVYALSK